MIKSCINCDEAFEGNRKQMFCSEECEKKYGQKAATKPPERLVYDFEDTHEEVTDCAVIKSSPLKKYSNILSDIEVTAADKERLSQLYGKNDRRKNKCGF